MKFRPRQDQKGLAFPKQVKVKRKAPTPLEKCLQTECELYLKALNFYYLHIPDELYRLCGFQSTIPIWIKKRLSACFKAFPDLLILRDGKYAAIELKRKGRKARPSQGVFLRDIGGKCFDNFEDFRAYVDKVFGIG